MFPTNLGENSLIIILGVAITTYQQKLYEAVVEELGGKINQFPATYKEASCEVNKHIGDLIELALQSAIVTNETDLVRRILLYSSKNTFRLACSEATISHALVQTYPNGNMESDYSILRILLTSDCNYRVKIDPMQDHKKRAPVVMHDEGGGFSKLTE